MNSFEGHITNINTKGNLSIVTVDCHGHSLKSIVIDTPETIPYLKEKQSVWCSFKETEVIIGLERTSAISVENQIPATITSIEDGVLLSRLELKTALGNLVAIISTTASQHLALIEGMKVVAMIKLNEITLAAG